MWPLTAREIYISVLDKKCPHIHFDEISINSICTDSRKITAGQFFIALQGEKFDGHTYLKECFEKGAALALVQKNSEHLLQLPPEHKEKCIEVENVVASFREFSNFFRRRFPFPVIAIGGSNGKTTSKEIIASLLNGENFKVTKTDKSENGFLGIPITLCKEEHNIKDPPHALVLEIGIDEMGAMQKHVEISEPDISLLTALGPEHLEKLKDWDSAANEEMFLFRNPHTKRVWQLSDEKIMNAFTRYLDLQNRGRIAHHSYPYSLLKDYLVIEKTEFEQDYTQKDFAFENTDKAIVWEITQQSAAQSTVKIEIYSKAGKLFSDTQLSFDIPLPGKHNAANFALSIATAIMLERTPRELASGWSQFTPPPMRSRIVTLKNGAVLFDDTYNSSPMSIEAALTTLESKEWTNKNKLLVLGDMLDLGDQSKYWHELLFEPLKNLQSSTLCLYGTAMYDCYKLLKETEKSLLSENKTRIFWLAPEEDPCSFLNQEGLDLASMVILIKGSRGMKLDRLVTLIEEKCS